MLGVNCREAFAYVDECGNFWHGWRPGIRWEMTTRSLTVDKKLVGVLEMHVNGDKHSFSKCCPRDGSRGELLVMPWPGFL